ncbi:hypothetical protein B0A54_15094 [Friedmanniomyces endolithicus]|uniref:Piwi domain-containing protein n=1 Tax=Friedmanniomyces endolithicus TaxID=329885 RepID=A0A4U0UEP8_9PEZI|nr:hypothetical protein LTS09_014591 [Friedmanniomyces endolithicus]TKA33914.1 hypothetical protein B0A54_15094 [Friedmanniomyces endolithicus]
MAERGRGRGRGGSGYASRGGGRGGSGSRGGYGDGQGRGGSSSRGGYGDSQGRGGGGNYQGGRDDHQGGRGGGGRGGYQGGGGGGRGGSQEMAFRSSAPREGVAPGIYLGDQPVPQPDTKITATEDKLVASTRGHMFEIGEDKTKVPGRRGYGKLGTPIILRTNYLTLTTAYESNLTEVPWFRYDVDAPNLHRETDAHGNETPGYSRDKKCRLFDQIVAHPKFDGITWATDNSKIIVTNKALPDVGKVPGWIETIVLPPPVGNSQNPTPNPPPNAAQSAVARNTVKFKVTLVGSYAPRQMIEYLKSTTHGATYGSAGDIVQTLNIIMAKPPRSAANVRDVGQNRFFPHEGHPGHPGQVAGGSHPGCEKYELGSGLQAMRGYYASVRPAIGRLVLNLNVTSGAFYKPLPLDQLINEFGPPRNDRDLEKLEGFLRMLKVKAVYIKNGQSTAFMFRIKTILGFERNFANPKKGGPSDTRFSNAKLVRFLYVDRSITDAKPVSTSVVDYFNHHHGIILRKPELPVLNVGTRDDPQYLPIELCTVLPGQPYKRLLNGDQTSEMLRFAARAPNQNAMSIAGTANAPGNGVRLFRLRDPPGGPDPQTGSVQPWGFRTGVDLITVPGRILRAPKVVYGRGQPENPSTGSWNLRQVQFYKPGKFGKWQVIVFNIDEQRGNALTLGDPEPLFDELGKTLKNYGVSMGARVRTPPITLAALTEMNRAANDSAVKTVFQNAEKNNVSVLFIVLPRADKWLYARIKYWGDIETGIHSINSVGSKLQKEKGQPMYLGNLCLKFNIKSGGVNHVIPNTFTKPLDNKTMLVGIDVTHPSPGSSAGAPSIACVVASTDEHLTQWPGSVRTQTGRQEMVNGLADMVEERLALWQKKHNGGLPDKIILYRDGVSEGQFDQVLTKEVPCFEAAFKKLYPAKSWPKLAVIIVGKHHHTRFYPTRQQDADTRIDKRTGETVGSWNPQPGTIVDRHITGRIIREFFLQAHQGLQGTARPAHYTVIRDDISFEADELEQFTHNLCYLFNRATKAVSIVPPAYYADLLCERGRAYLFSTLAENHGSESSVFNASGNEWTSGVHPNLAESTWYI